MFDGFNLHRPTVLAPPFRLCPSSTISESQGTPRSAGSSAYSYVVSSTWNLGTLRPSAVM